ncbi:MAG TPA: SRPBCC domain-containing protein [Pseudonocardiaceae bacterium]|nr:SRPBCC domain-containing protein [Pseudonocardiaceae bacterium]
MVDHDLTPGGRMTYVMTGPEGDKHAGYWQITAVDEPTSFSFEDGFADLDFTRPQGCRSPRTSTPSPSTTATPARPT